MTNDNIELASKALDDFAIDLEIEVNALIFANNMDYKLKDIEDVIIHYQRNDEEIIYKIIAVFENFNVCVLHNYLNVKEIANSIFTGASNFEEPSDVYDEFDDFKIKREEDLKWLNARFAVKTFCD